MFLTNFADPKEANQSQSPLNVIQEAFDQNEGKQEEESLDEAEPIEHSTELAEVEPLMNGKGDESHS